MKAITREEKIMSGENLTPITRKEMFLAKAAGQNIETPIPITREEMFLSKITGGGGSTNLPLAYTVSSVKELPSNAVDGSMAIVPSDSLIGEWEFHNEPKINEIASGHEDIATQYSFLFSSCTADNIIVVFDMVVIRSYPDDDTYSMDFGSGGKLDAYPDVYWTDEEGWGNENSKRINIMSNIEDVTFAEWLPQNAERLSGGYSLYTHENGEWVYKCEVV